MAPDPRVVVVTDSAASLPPGAEPELGVTVVPMTVVVGGEEHHDGVLPAGEILRRLGRQPVSTSAPSPGDFLRRIEAAAGRSVLIATVARQMSASYEAATTACGYVETPTAVVDTGTAAGGQGLVVAAAARAAAAGRPLDEVAAEARRVARRVRLVAALDSLDQLARSGRVPGVAALASRSLGLRPLFELAGGKATARRPAAGRRAALERIVAACSPGSPGLLRCAVLHADAAGVAGELEAMVLDAAPTATTFVAPFSSVMVAHTGAGVVGLAWWWTAGAPEPRSARDGTAAGAGGAPPTVPPAPARWRRGRFGPCPTT